MNVKVIYFGKIKVSLTRRPIHFCEISVNTPCNSCRAKDPPFEGIPSLWTHPAIVKELQPGHLAECSSSGSVELRAWGNQEDTNSRSSACNAVALLVTDKYTLKSSAFSQMHIYRHAHPPSPYHRNKHFYRVLAIKRQEQIGHKSGHKNVKLSEVPSAINRVVGGWWRGNRW